MIFDFDEKYFNQNSISFILGVSAFLSIVYNRLYEFSQLFEPPVEACTSVYVGILAQKANQLGSLLDPGW